MGTFVSYLTISSLGKFVKCRFSFNKFLRNLDKTHGVLPIMAYTWRLHPKGVPFPGFRYIKGRGISLVEEYMGKDGPENLSFRSVKRPKRDNRYILWLLKRRENVLDLCWVLSVSYLCLAKLIFT